MQLFSGYFGNEVKIQIVREKKPVRKVEIKKPADVYELVRDEFARLDREVFLVITLNSKNRVLGINTVSVGSVDSSLAHPREVFKPAILQNATSIVLVHNHPSGDTEPSEEDLTITKKLVSAGEMLEINVLDHVIVGRKHFSFSDNGLITKERG